MADNFLDSPWFQVGAPLAATIATAIAPRHAGPAAAIGMAGYNGINRSRYDSMRLSQLRQKHQNDEDQAANLMALFTEANSGVQNDPNQPHPEAGSVPEVTENLKTDTLSSGRMPRMSGAAFTPEQSHFGQMLVKAGRYGEAASFAKEVMTQRMSDASRQPAKPERHFTNFTNPDNQSVTNVLTFNPEGGTNETSYINGDIAAKPEKTGEPKYIDWGYGKKKKISPDGTEEIVNVPVAPKEPKEPKDPDAYKLTFDQMMVLRSTGRSSGNERFDMLYSSKDAENYLNKKKSASPFSEWDMLRPQQGQQPEPIKPNGP